MIHPSKVFKPLQDHVLVKPLDVETTLASGIVLPQKVAEKDQPVRAIVMAHGPGKVNNQGIREPLTVKVADEVICNKFAGSELKIDGIYYLVLQEEDILVVLDEVEE